MDSLQLLKIWLELECIDVDGDLLTRIKGNTCDDIEIVLIAKLVDIPDYRYFFRHGYISKNFSSLDLDHCFESDEDYVSLFSRIGIKVSEIRREITYHFKDEPEVFTPDIGYMGDTSDTHDTVAILHDGEIVSKAWSVRRNDRAAEIAIETKEGFRRRGYGKQVTAGWVKYILSLGKEAIYSHRKGNLESMALANSVSANQFVEVLSFHSW